MKSVNIEPGEPGWLYVDGELDWTCPECDGDNTVEDVDEHIKEGKLSITVECGFENCRAVYKIINYGSSEWKPSTYEVEQIRKGK